eukprot:COSAG06_NODE_432_length_15846_cov_18.957325_9_plen_77_part_00
MRIVHPVRVHRSTEANGALDRAAADGDGARRTLAPCIKRLFFTTFPMLFRACLGELSIVQYKMAPKRGARFSHRRS